MGYILAITNQKGGVGKTTTAAALGAALQDSGKRVLLVDLDPQGSLTNALGLRNPPAALYEALDAYIRGEEWALADLVLPLPTGEALVPGTIELAACELTLVNAQRREYALSELLAALEARTIYDWVLIDCPPALGLLTLNAMTAADAVLIPVTPEHMAVRGLGMLLDSVNRVRGPRGRRWPSKSPKPLPPWPVSSWTWKPAWTRWPGLCARLCRRPGTSWRTMPPA